MGLPNVMGVAFAYMPILTMIGTQYGILCHFGSQLVAGFVSIFIGMFMGKIRRFFPPIVSGTVVLSIGLTLYETAMNYMGGGSAAQNAGTFGSGQFLDPCTDHTGCHAGLQPVRQRLCTRFRYADRHPGRLCDRAVHGRHCGLQQPRRGRLDLAAPPILFQPGVPSGRNHYDDPDVRRPGCADDRRCLLDRYGRLWP